MKKVYYDKIIKYIHLKIKEMITYFPLTNL